MATAKTRGAAAAALVMLSVVCELGLAPVANAQTVAGVRATAPSVLTPRGTWSPSVQYARDDLVTSRGSAWLARRASIGKMPGQTQPSTARFWELFAGGLNPLGAWISTRRYQPDDLVTFLGSTWRAKLTNRNHPPNANPAEWEQFAAKGNRGRRGVAGAEGAPGPKGDTGARGPRGLQGAAGEAGPRGPRGRRGPAGSIAAVPDGSVSAPAIKFSSSGDTGIFSPAAGKIALTAGGRPFLHNIGSVNTALGFRALEANTGQGNTAIGESTLQSSTSANFNTAVGAQALLSNSTGNNNTAVGGFALLANGTGDDNTAVGSAALLNISTNSANGNTAVGSSALLAIQSGNSNTAVGFQALRHSTIAFNNTAVGTYALFFNTNGDGNVAVGEAALNSNTTGSFNIAIGFGAGNFPTAPSDSIFIGNGGSTGDTRTIKIGEQGMQNSAFIAGIRGTTTGVSDALPVVIDSKGQLGTVSSSRRYKQDIHAMADPSATLMELRPVTFRYKKAYDDGTKPIQYGLIAEEVAEVLPGLAVLNRSGQPETVKYHLLPTFLLAAYQRDHRTVQAEADEIAREREIIEAQAKLIADQQNINRAQAEAISELQRRLSRLDARFAALKP